MNIRRALGAGRLALCRQLLIESLVLSIAGGALGPAARRRRPRGSARWAPTALPLYAELRVSGWAIAFTVALSLFAPLLFGMAPAMLSLEEKDCRTTASRNRASRRSVRDLLVIAEVALSVVLVVGAGLLVRSLIQLGHVDPGFKPEV